MPRQVLPFTMSGVGLSLRQQYGESEAARLVADRTLMHQRTKTR